jgi:hypothetical protein
MNYKSNFHTDVKINTNTKLKILLNDKIVSTGYLPDTNNRPINTAKKMLKGDNIVIKLISYSRACKNPDEPYLIFTRINCVKQFSMNSDEMKLHREILLPLVNNKKTKTYKNKRHQWFNDWNINTNVFGVKVEEWNNDNIFTFNNIQNLNTDNIIYKIGNFKYISSTYQKIKL